MEQHVIDTQNAVFWNELCGTAFARELGIKDVSKESLRRFDEAFLKYYPYLTGYILPYHLEDKKVLEIGLGYGTLGQFLASRGCDYHGLDIAQGPVDMMKYRLGGLLGLQADWERKIQVGSALAIPYDEQTFDYLYSIGCLHHTGDLSKAVAEVYRVLKPGGKAIVMLYSRESFVYWSRIVSQIPHAVKSWLKGKLVGMTDLARAAYDSDSTAEAAPYTDFSTRADIRKLFRSFRSVQIDTQNFVWLRLPYFSFARLKWRLLRIPREELLNNLGRITGSDFYITAQK